MAPAADATTAVTEASTAVADRCNTVAPAALTVAALTVAKPQDAGATDVTNTVWYQKNAAWWKSRRSLTLTEVCGSTSTATGDGHRAALRRYDPGERSANNVGNTSIATRNMGCSRTAVGGDANITDSSAKAVNTFTPVVDAGAPVALDGPAIIADDTAPVEVGGGASVPSVPASPFCAIITAASAAGYTAARTAASADRGNTVAPAGVAATAVTATSTAVADRGNALAVVTVAALAETKPFESSVGNTCIAARTRHMGCSRTAVGGGHHRTSRNSPRIRCRCTCTSHCRYKLYRCSITS